MVKAANASSLVLRLPGKVTYRTVLRRCAYEWFLAEYPPADEVEHEVFHYPA